MGTARFQLHAARVLQVGMYFCAGQGLDAPANQGTRLIRDRSVFPVDRPRLQACRHTHPALLALLALSRGPLSALHTPFPSVYQAIRESEIPQTT